MLFKTSLNEGIFVFKKPSIFETSNAQFSCLFVISLFADTVSWSYIFRFIFLANFKIKSFLEKEFLQPTLMIPLKFFSNSLIIILLKFSVSIEETI